MSIFSRSSAFSRSKPEEKAREVLATFNDEENQALKHNAPEPTATGPSMGDLERWYYLLNSITTRGIMDPQDWEDLDSLRDEVYAYLR